MIETGCRTSEPALAYVVTYEYDPSTRQGCVYLPGKTDEWYRLNSGSIWRRGLEGNWFAASSAWLKFVSPIIERAATAPRMKQD